MKSRNISGIFQWFSPCVEYRSDMFGKNERTSSEKENLRSGVGRLGENLACAHLERGGFSILERNWTAWAAEIDVVATDDA